MQFHASSDTHIGTVLSKDEHTIMCARAAASPLFVLPLSTAPGRFHTLLLQWQPPHRLLFTTLEEFKQWGPQAPPHLTVQLYEDLKDSHALVLARGDLLSTQLIGAAQVYNRVSAHFRGAAAPSPAHTGDMPDAICRRLHAAPAGSDTAGAGARVLQGRCCLPHGIRIQPQPTTV